MWLYYLLWGLAWGVRFFPDAPAYALCDRLGAFGFDRVGKFRRIVLFNLRLAFEGEDDATLEKIGRACFAHQAKSVFEMLKYFHASSRRGAQRVAWQNGESFFQYRGKAVLVAGAHAGNWELLTHAIQEKGMALTGVGAVIRQKGMNRFVETSRLRRGMEIIYRDPGVVQRSKKALENGRQLALMADQHAGDRGLIVYLFEQPAWTFKGPAKFAQETGLPLLPMFSYRRKDNRLVLVMGAPIEPVNENGPVPMYDLLQMFQDQLEDFVRAYPESYFWMHRRFKGLLEGA